MENQIKSPVWKMIWCYLIITFMIICIALMSSCGARKVETSIDKSADKFSDKSTGEGLVITTSQSVDNSSIKIKTDKVDEAQARKITELFNENGTLKSRITELLNTKSIDNTITGQKSVQRLYINTDSSFTNTHYITRDINHYVKDKKSDTNNRSLYWMLFGIGGLLVVGFFVYKYVTNKVVTPIVKI